MLDAARAANAALAWDPPVAFKWSYSVVQGGGAIGGWLLGATVGVAFVDFLATLVLLAALMPWYGWAPEVRLAALPLPRLFPITAPAMAPSAM